MTARYRSEASCLTSSLGEDLEKQRRSSDKETLVLDLTVFADHVRRVEPAMMVFLRASFSSPTPIW